MNIESVEVGGVVVVKLKGRVDQTTAAQFSTALNPLVAQCVKGAAPLVLDATGLEYISSVGLRALMMVSRQVKSQQGKIAMACLNPVVEEVFTITRFNLIMPWHANVDAASKALLS